MKDRLHGVIPALVTPYDEDGEIDKDVTRQLVNRLLGQGVHGFYLGGSTGEGPLQSPEERLAFVATVLDAVGGRVPVIAHVGTADTPSTLRLAREAGALGVDAVSAVAPYYYRHAPAQVRAHFLRVADESPVPFIAYHLAATSNLTAGSDFFAELASHPNIVGVKFTSRDVFELQRLVATGGADLAVFSGADEVFIHGIIAGANGAIGSTYNFMAGVYLRAYEALAAGDHTSAAELQAQANAVLSAGGPFDNVAFAREVVRAQGIDVGPARQPIAELDADERRFIAGLVAEHAVLRD